MKIQEILNSTNHRPWAMPQEIWKFYQEWNNVVFLHWPVNGSELRKYVPEEIEIDLIDGQAWISIVPFTMEKIRPRYLPPFPPISNFHEINIRTYVKHNEKTGVYFLSIEGGTKISCKISRLLSELPYRYSKMKRSLSNYKSSNSEFDDLLDIEFKIGEAITDKTELDKWLTERYALFQDGKKGINEFEIHHLEWPMYELDLTKADLQYFRFDNLWSGPPVLSHYSPGVQVIAWDKKNS